MGGLIGLALASLPGNPIRKLVLNDIGSTLNTEALVRIGNHLGLGLKFSTLDEAVQYVRSISTTFGAHTEAEWQKFATDVLRQNPDGSWTTHYDPGIAVPFKLLVANPNGGDAELLKKTYEAVTCETLLVRGAQSDILAREVALEMTRSGPKAKLVEIPDVGHAPTFMHADQIAIARDFLLG
jgi:pimeloyl-ACP methyl ester carboxylesterase